MEQHPRQKPKPQNKKTKTQRSSLPTFQIEQSLWNQGYSYVAGVDEVGRGCLAGPVVSAAVILPFEGIPEGINDSKKLSAKKREELFDAILACAIACEVASCSVGEIDSINILQASKLSMVRCIQRLAIRPQYLLVDGRERLDIDVPQQTVVGGDGKSLSIAAASILAKVARDRWMKRLDGRYPGYGFTSNKGYGSIDHRRALQSQGPSPEHRQSFSWTPVV